MKFTPKSLPGNVNVSKTHPIKELFWLAGGMFLLAGSLYFLLGLLADWGVAKTSPDIENWLGEQAVQEFAAEPDARLQTHLDAVLDAAPQDSVLHDYTFTVYRSNEDLVNALALPGGRIIVYAGLLQEVESENELTMILAHELGHFAHRDHLRGLGRGLGLAVAGALLFGYDNSAGDLLASTLFTYQVKYSQTQEENADSFGLDLLVSRYGHAGGAVDFFARAGRTADGRGSYVFAAHPHPEERLEKLEARISEQGYVVGPVLPLSFKP